MRQIADRLEAERRGPARAGEAETVGSKIMVAMSSNPKSTKLLLRRASSIAGRLNTNWFAVYVRTKRESPHRMPAREHRLLSENVTLAMELGAKVVWLTGEDVAGELLRFAREHGITLVLLGKSKLPLWRRVLRKRPIDALAGGGTGIDVLEVETETP
jgi:two-component system, OmpR family, sensor histidine kinase KdpD